MLDLQDKLSIRVAGPADAEMLSHIGAATFIESYTEDIEGSAMIAHCTKEHSVELYAGYLADPDVTCWIAEYAATGAPVGYAVNCPPDLPVKPQPGDQELKRIYLLSRFHGSGAGRALLDASIGQARAAGAPRLLLGTYEENIRAMTFYGKHGFKKIGTRQFNVGGRIYDDIVMALSLKVS